jgi:hypothetical protein
MFLVDISGSKLPNLIYWVSGFELGSSGLRSWPEIKDLFKNHPVLPMWYPIELVQHPLLLSWKGRLFRHIFLNVGLVLLACNVLLQLWQRNPLRKPIELSGWFSSKQSSYGVWLGRSATLSNKQGQQKVVGYSSRWQKLILDPDPCPCCGASQDVEPGIERSLMSTPDETWIHGLWQLVGYSPQ